MRLFESGYAKANNALTMRHLNKQEQQIMAKALKRSVTVVEERFVEVVSYENHEVVKRLGPLAPASADKIDAGMNINLDHERYFTRIVRT